MKDKKNSPPSGSAPIKRRSQLLELWRRLKKNRMAIVGLVILLTLILVSVFADQIAPYHYDDQDVSRRYLSPCKEYLFGTDNLGRDIFSRVIYGGRVSLQVGIIAVSVSAGIGITLGSISGYYSGIVDSVIMRVMDIFMAIPNILLAIAIAAALGPGIINAMIAVGVSNIPRYARIVRASVLSVRDQEFVEAARTVNASPARIIFRHILPNVMAPVIVQSTLGVAQAILMAASLSFIGLGVQPPIPEWGAMLSAGRQSMRDYWHVVTFPGLAIMLSIFSLNLFGDGLRDALDPRLKS